MTAADYDFSLTRNEIIQSAFRKIGILGVAETLSAELQDMGLKALGLIIKDWQTEGHAFLWSELWLSQQFTATIVSYALPTATPLIWIEKAFIRDTAGDDIPLELITWAKYCEIQDKDQAGDPLCMAVNWQDSKMYFWPVPDDTQYCYYLATQRLKDWDTAAGTGDLPIRFQRALIYQLAADLGDDFGVETDKLEAKAYTLLSRAKRSDKETTTNDFLTGAFSVK
jgi:hypothetical protein